MEIYDQMKHLMSEVEKSIEWVAMENDKAYPNNEPSFFISKAHSNIKLVRAGQYSCGGQNYHASPEAFNTALIEAILINREQLFKDAIKIQQERVEKAVLKCEKLAVEILENIAEIRGE